MEEKISDSKQKGYAPIPLSAKEGNSEAKMNLGDLPAQELITLGVRIKRLNKLDLFDSIRKYKPIFDAVNGNSWQVTGYTRRYFLAD